MKYTYHILLILFLFISSCSYPSTREDMANKIGKVIYRSHKGKYHTNEYFIVVDGDHVKAVEINSSAEISNIIILPNLKSIGSENGES